LESPLQHLPSREMRPEKRVQRWQPPMEAAAARRSAPSPLLCRHQSKTLPNQHWQGVP